MINLNEILDEIQKGKDPIDIPGVDYIICILTLLTPLCVFVLYGIYFWPIDIIEIILGIAVSALSFIMSILLYKGITIVILPILIILNNIIFQPLMYIYKSINKSLKKHYTYGIYYIHSAYSSGVWYFPFIQTPILKRRKYIIKPVESTEYQLRHFNYKPELFLYKNREIVSQVGYLSEPDAIETLIKYLNQVEQKNKIEYNKGLTIKYTSK